jgi:hypothetical protein
LIFIHSPKQRKNALIRAKGREINF